MDLRLLLILWMEKVITKNSPDLITTFQRVVTNQDIVNPLETEMAATTSSTSFHLYTRNQPNGIPFETTNPLALVLNANLNVSRPTAIYIPGVNETVFKAYGQFINEFLDKDDVNLILTDWQVNAFHPVVYVSHILPQITSLLTTFLKQLSVYKTISIETITLIEQSSGGIIIGLGRDYNKMNKIISLDPKGPCYYLRTNHQRSSFGFTDIIEIVHCSAGNEGFSIDNSYDTRFNSNEDVVQWLNAMNENQFDSKFAKRYDFSFKNAVKNSVFFGIKHLNDLACQMINSKL